jgi:hypothetical protein
MICLIWRQHRGQALWTIITMAVLCVLAVNFGLNAEHWLAGYHAWLRQLAAAGCPPPNARSGDYHVNNPAACLALKGRYPGSLQAAFASRYSFAILLSQYGLPAAFAVTGAIIGAPLVAREVEQRTHLAAWTQSVSRRRGRRPGPLPPGRPVLAATAHPAHSPARPRRGGTGSGLARHPDTRRLGTLKTQQAPGGGPAATAPHRGETLR